MFLCDRIPHARLLSAQCVTLLEFCGASVSAPSCSTMWHGKPRLRLAPSAAWCSLEFFSLTTLCQNPAAARPHRCDALARLLSGLCAFH